MTTTMMCSDMRSVPDLISANTWYTYKAYAKVLGLSTTHHQLN